MKDNMHIAQWLQCKNACNSFVKITYHSRYNKRETARSARHKSILELAAKILDIRFSKLVKEGGVTSKLQKSIFKD